MAKIPNKPNRNYNSEIQNALLKEPIQLERCKQIGDLARRMLKMR